MTFRTEQVIARLDMLSGNLCSLAELALILEQYGYREDPKSGLWILEAEDDIAGACAIGIESEGEVLSIFGSEVDHFTNLNYVMRKAGWTKCKVRCDSGDNEAKLLARLVSVDIESVSAPDLPASSLQANAAGAGEPPTKPQPVSGPMQADVVDDESALRIEQLTIRCNSVEERAAELESLNASLMAENQQLKKATAPIATSPAIDVSASVDGSHLLGAIESFLSKQIDVVQGKSTLIEDLRSLGYEVRLRLVRADHVRHN
ncbi:hypothetical protein [Paracidovorax citrulli]